MRKYKKPNVDAEKLGINPFLLNLKIPVNKITMVGQFKPDKDGDILPVELELEKDSACRIYVDAARRKQMATLSSRGKDLLLWIIYEVENGKDWLCMNKGRYMEECSVKSRQTCGTALVELQKSGFILPTVVQGVYWINPHLLFNGSRIAKFPDNLVRK